MKFYCENAEEVMNQVNSSENGLTETEAQKRLEENGKNRLVAAKGKSIFRRFLEQLADPMIIILLAAAAVSGALAAMEPEGEFVDVIIILAVVIINAVLGVYQESKAEKAIEALQEMSAATSKVLRDGNIMHIPSEDLVVGDVIILEAGDAVPADARIIENASLKIEEAALTGESVPVTKFIELINLKEDEKVIWYSKPRLKSLVLTALLKVLPIALFWIVIDTSFIIIMIKSKMFSQNINLAFIIIPFFIIHLSPVWIWFSGLLKSAEGYKTITYALTDKRIIIKNSCYGTDIRSINLEEISSVLVYKDTVDKLIKTGDVICKGEFLDVCLYNVDDSFMVKDLISERIVKG